jgi:hypothetical protein
MSKFGRFLPHLLLLASLWLGGCTLLPASGPDACDSSGRLFSDDFVAGQDCGWALFSRSGVTVEKAGEVLQISTNQPGQFGWSTPDRDFADVVITAQTRQVSGPDDNAYGLICRYQSEENYYVFLISGDGHYAIGKYQTGEPQIIYLTENQGFVYSDVINQGTATNEIRASCVGNELSLTVNGTPLVTLTDPTFVTGDIGVGAATFQPGTLVVQFDNVTVVAP